MQPHIAALGYNWWTDRAGQAIVAIVVHNTEGTDSRAYLARGGELPDGSDRKVSVHALIRKDGTLYRSVPDARGANHAGFGTMPPGLPQLNPNRCTLGIELENRSDGRSIHDPYTDAQLLTLGWEINRIRAQYGPMPIFRHADLDPKRRRDTADLTIDEMEAWARKAALAPIPADPPICGPATCTLEQAAALLLSVPHPGYTRMDISVIVGGYFDICARAGVDPCVAIAQLCHETGCLTSWWSQRPRRNPAGIGVTGRQAATKPAKGTWQKQNNVWLEGCAFGSWVAESIPAHVGRLLAYAVKPGDATPAQAALIETALAVRSLPAEYVGAAPTVGGLAGRWAVPGTEYRAAIVGVMERIRGL